MFTSIENFLSDWTLECTSTEKLYSNLTDESLSQKAWEHGRELGRLSWHLALSTAEMLNTAGLHVQGPEENSPTPASATVILETLKQVNTASIPEIKKWTDDMLQEEVPMYGRSWKRGFVLTVLLHHHIHHRGQMTVLMRQAGLKVPGMHGPSRDEWLAFGKEPLA